MFGRVKYWITVAFKDDIPKSREELIPPEYFAPRVEYRDDQINSDIIIHNHLNHIEYRADILGRALNRVYADLGEVRGVVGLLKRVVLFFVGAAMTAYIANNLALFGG